MDLETWLGNVLPEGLPDHERERRATQLRASVSRCAGFVGQTQVASEVEGLSRRARGLGSDAEKLRHAIDAQPRNAQPDEPEIARLSCNVIQRYPENPTGIRLISTAMHNAAGARPSHMLNAASIQASGIALILAFCDLDSEGCDAHSNNLVSICAQFGQCSYQRDEESWQANTSEEDYAAAQELRVQIGDSVRQRDCKTLFE
ncbi:MAG: hypothetical protein ABI831_15190 [Betaproteobacteria bacterium]